MGSLAENSGLLSLIVLVFVTVFFLRWSQRNLKASAKRIREAQTRPAENVEPGHNLDAPADVARWEIQMHDTARDLSGQLDSKIAILQQLIRTAEEHIVRLERAIEQAGGSVPSPGEADNGPRQI